MDNVIELVTRLGFPIAVCIGLAWYVLKKDKDHTKEVEKLGRSIDNNTKVVTELIMFLKGGCK